MHIIINLAAGCPFVDGVPPMNASYPVKMLIDYVKVYQKPAMHNKFTLPRFEVRPNFSKDLVTISIDTEIPLMDIKGLFIYDVFGKKTYETSVIESYETVIEINNYSPGFHLVILSLKNGRSSVNKFLKF